MQFKRLFSTIAFLFIPLLASFAQKPMLLDHGGGVRTVEFSPVDAFLLASAGETNVIKLWNLRNNTARTLRGHTDIVNSVAFSPNGELLASVSDDRTICFWNVQSQQSVATQSTTDRYQSIAFSPDGQIFATGGQHVKLWSAHNRTEMATLQHNQYVRTVAFSPNGQLLAVGNDSGTVKVWNIQSRQVVVSLDANPKDVKAVEFSSDSRYLAGSGWNGYLKIWNTSNWELLGEIPNTGHYDIAFSPDGKTLVSTDRRVVFWSVETGENIISLPAPDGWRHPIDFSADGATLAVGGDDGTLRIYPIEERLQSGQQPGIVKLIYFLPRGVTRPKDIDTKLDRLIKEVQQFYAEEMQRYGFGRKTFTFETSADGRTVVHHVDGKFDKQYYQEHDTAPTVWKELSQRFYRPQDIHVVVIAMSKIRAGGNLFQGGDASTIFGDGREVLQSACDSCLNKIGLTAHELGHAFGLDHDFRSEAYIMSYGRDRYQLSKCAAKWLDAHRSFNTHQTSHNERSQVNSGTTIQMLPPRVSRPYSVRLRFEISDPDGLHQAQLLIPTTVADPALYFKIQDCRSLDAENQTIEFITSELTGTADTEVALQVIDKHGSITRQRFPLNIVSLLPSPKRVAIPDTRLAAAIRKALGLKQRQPITDLNMLKLTGLDAENQQIGSITGLEYAVNLRRLHLNRNQIRDLTPLKKLEQLSTLWLVENQIRDVRSLTRLVGLTTLRLAGNPVQDFTPLRKLLDQNPQMILDVESSVNPLPKITGPWLWMIAPVKGGGGKRAINIDSLSKASGGIVTEADIATNGARAGDIVGDYTWTRGEIADTGSNNINDLIHKIGLVGGGDPQSPADDRDIDDHSSYAFIILKSATVQSDVTMRAGSDDAIKVWINGEVVHNKRVNRGATDFQDEFKVDLKKVDNFLLVKVSERGGHWSMFIGIDGDVKPTGLGLGDVIMAKTSELIPDENLAVIVQDALGVGENGRITKQGLRNLTELRGREKNISDLTGLEHATQLRTLSLADNRIHDLSPLAGLTELRGISLFRNQIRDLSPLTELTKLEWLDIGGNKIKSITPVEGLTQLEWLSLWDNQISDIRPIKGLAQLNRLDLRNNQIRNIRPIRGLTGLTELHLEKNKIENITHLAGLKNLEVLKLQGNPIADYAPLRHLKAKNPDVEIDIDINAAAPAAPRLPVETALLPNYPNPFNPETWIPYQLSKPAEVTLTIYAVNGNVVRRLALGHQSVGIYHNKSHAAYWNGRNEQGERVASGIYFYTLSAGDFTAAQKMFIRK